MRPMPVDELRRLMRGTTVRQAVEDEQQARLRLAFLRDRKLLPKFATRD